MFPIPFNFPFIRQDGSRTTIGAAMGGGSQYELPPATSDTLGGVKVGDGLSITEAGVLSVSGGGAGGALSSVTQNVPQTSVTASEISRVLLTEVPEGKTPVCVTFAEATGYTQRNWITSLTKGTDNKWGVNFFVTGSGSLTLIGTLTIYYV